MSATFGPDQARLVLEAAGLPALRMEHGLTGPVLAAIPPDGMAFRPSAGARTAGELARHIAAVEHRFLTLVAAGSFDEPDAEVAGAADAAAIARIYDTRFGPVFERVARLSGEDLLRPLSYKGLVGMPALGFVQFAVNHTIHHRGQLSVYLRALGVPVPPIYG